MSSAVNTSGSPPRAFTASATTELAVSVGMPTGPGHTGVELYISAQVAAARGGKPREIKRGAANAAGVPKPAAPSMKPPKR